MTAAPVSGDARRIVRVWSDVVLLAVGLVVLALSALPVERHHVPGAEETAFDAVNGAPTVWFAPVWVVMQLGNIAVVGVAAVAALVCRRPRLAAGLAAGGAIVYLVAKLIKRVVVRGRPDALLAGVEIRGDPSAGLGFVSGHAAVITALAVIAAPYLGRRWRVVVYAVAVVVCLTRVYVGAHLPLDVIGGAALGLAAGAAVRLLLGRPGSDDERRAPGPDDGRRAPGPSDTPRVSDHAPPEGRFGP